MKKRNLKKYILMLSVMSTPLIVEETINKNIAEANNQSKWEQNNQGQWSWIENGVTTKNTIKYLGGSYFYFDANGIMKENGWVEYNGNWYYAKKGGYLAISEIQYLGGSYFCFDANGIMVTNKEVIDTKGDKYYAKAGGYLARNETINGVTYGEDAKAKKQETKEGWNKNNQGQWSWIENGVTTKNAIKYLGGSYFYFDANGIMKENGWGQYNGNWYYAKAGGYLVRNEIQYLGGSYFYFDANGIMKENGWVQYNGNWYYSKAGGYLVRNETQYLGGSYFYFDASGIMVTNKEVTDNQGNKYYAKAGGYLARNETINGVAYGEDAKAKKQETKEGWQQNNQGQWSWIENGVAIKNAIKYLGGSYFYFDANGIMKENGWAQYNGNWYYAKAGGYLVRNEIQYLGGSYFYFNDKGEMLEKDWVQHNGNWYYAKEGGYLARNEWAGHYYLGNDGKMLVDTWTPDGYFVDSSGKWVENKTIVPNSNNHVVYYMQDDYNWKSKVYGYWNMGSTGCVPTSLAMIISTLVENVSPVSIADYLYYNTTAFNKIGAGTSSQGIPIVLNKYALKYNVINSKDQLADELSKGNIVYAVVDDPPFTVAGTSHAIVLRGIDSAQKTTVYNPLSGWGVKQYSIDKIWSQRGTHPEDTSLGSPFIAIYK